MKRIFKKMKYMQQLLANSAHTRYKTASARTHFLFISSVILIFPSMIYSELSVKAFC